jgi:hypothetical protein
MIINSDDNKSLIITYDLKVEIDTSITDLNLILIKMGIKSWDSHRNLADVSPDYYIFTNFEYLDSDNINDNKYNKNKKSNYILIILY